MWILVIFEVLIHAINRSATLWTFRNFYVLVFQGMVPQSPALKLGTASTS